MYSLYRFVKEYKQILLYCYYHFMNIFSRLVIYKIICNDICVNDIYIGSTVNFRHRGYQHKYNSKYSDIKLYKNIRENGGWVNYSIIELEKFPCNNSIEARERERYYYDLLNPNLNSIKPNNQ